MKGGSERFAYRDSKDILETLEVEQHSGLSAGAVRERMERFGCNVLRTAREGGVFTKIVGQFKSPLVLVLVAAGFVTLFLREYVDTLVILAALALNVGVGVFQEERASHAFEKLNASQEHVARVLREGNLKEVLTTALVPGDIVELHAGAYVPADLRLLYTKELLVNESVLTGEWTPVGKISDTLEKEVPLAEARNMAWMGTLVASGHGRGIVTKTGE